MSRSIILGIAILFATALPARAGLYYSGEPIADLPSQWRGFLLDHRALRSIAVAPPPGAAPHPLRESYGEARLKLSQIASQRPLTADEAADLGALHVRLGAIDAGLDVLRAAHREHPDHFHVAANLGTTYQLKGDMDQAALALRVATRLAPLRWKKAEELHLRLILLRRTEPRDAQALDDLFGIRYGTNELAKVPPDAVALTQQLALWLPADGRLLWQLGELANIYGDTRMAAAMLDGCVTEFGLSHPDLRRRRHEYRAIADDMTRQDPATRNAVQAVHEGHAGRLAFRSPRPLSQRVDANRLPPIRPDGLNPLPWGLLAETAIDRARPRFPEHLRKLDGQRVALVGFMQPIGDGLEMAAFLMIEFPVGCWFCEVPEPTGLVLVELPPGKHVTLSRRPTRIEGRLALNAADPENFLYTIREAKVGEPD